MHLRLAVAALLAAGLLLVAPTVASAATNLGALWHLDESSGTTALDSSGNDNHGAITGATSGPGRFGRALTFDGIDDQVAVPRSPSLEPATTTVEAWVRAGASPGEFRHIVSQGASQCIGASYGLYTGAGGGLAFYISDGQTFTVSPAADPTIWNGEWHHVAGTFDGATVRLFVDGAQVGLGMPSNLTILYGLSSTSDGLLGAYGGPCEQSHDYAGDLDEPRVWSRALSPEELAASAAMGGPATVRLGHRVDSTQALVYSSEFSNGRHMKISTESSTGSEKIKSIKMVGLLPLTSRATCRGGLLSLLDSSCSFTLSNGGRTAALDVEPLLGEPVVTLRVTVSSGRTFAVVVDTSGRNAITLQASVQVSAGT